MRPPRTQHLPARWVDGAVAVVITGVGLVETWAAPGPAAATGLMVVLVGAALWWRRSQPLPLLLIVLAAAVVLPALGAEPFPLYLTLAMFVAAYSVAAYAPLIMAVAGQVVAIAVLWYLTLTHGGSPQDAGLFGIFWVVLWVLGRLVRRLREREMQLHRTSQELATRRAEFAQVVIFAERARIARELHDVVAHSVNVMLVQAGGARSVVDRGGPVPRDALLAIESTGRRALDELDRLLGILRRPDDGAPGLDPPPQLDGLPDLAAAMSKAGLHTEVIVDGEPRHLSEMLQLSAYRIVQEALTNALRHRKVAGPATVLVRYGDTGLDIEIRDRGQGLIEQQRQGRGQVGMRERVALFGGTINMGPTNGGEYLVRATLPSPPSTP